jgi:hypothetical protein
MAINDIFCYSSFFRFKDAMINKDTQTKEIGQASQSWVLYPQSFLAKRLRTTLLTFQKKSSYLSPKLKITSVAKEVTGTLRKLVQ